MFFPLFTNQKSYENVLLVLRRHPFILFMIFARFFIMLLPVVLIPVGIWVVFGAMPYAVMVIAAIYALLWWGFLFRALADFYLDVWIVTDHRIVAIEQKDLFNRDLSELRLWNIQDVNVKVSGLFATFLNYGKVEIQTAGTVPEFQFLQVADPYKVKDIIMSAYDAFSRSHPNGMEVHEK